MSSLIMRKKKQQKVESEPSQADIPAILKCEQNPILQEYLSKQFSKHEKLSRDERNEMWVHLHLTFLSHWDKILNLESDNEHEQIPNSDADNTVTINSSLASNKEKTASTNADLPINDKSESVECARTIVQMIHQSLLESDVIPIALGGIVHELPSLLKSPDIDLKFKNEIIRLMEVWLKKELKLRPSTCFQMYTYFLEKTASTEKSVLKMDMERVWKFRVALQQLLQVGCPETGALVQILSKLPQNKHFVRSKVGCNFISFLFTIHKSLVVNLYASVKVMLPTAKHTEAVAVGDMIVGAWLKSSTEMRLVISDECVQNLMSHVFTLPRQGLEMNKLGKNVLAVLTSFHTKRTHPQILKLLADLYEPLLWRYLQSANSIHRCNATQVFFSAYPLQQPGSGGMARSMLEERQHKLISDLLRDKCHIVRVTSIANVCKLMDSHWLVLPSEWIKRWMKILVVELSVDGSSADVRRSVFQNLSVLVDNPHALDFMKEVVEKLQPQLHDVSELVRKAFLRLLIRLRDAGDTAFWKYAPLPHLLARLEVEGAGVGQLITDLLFSSYCGAKLPAATQLKRIMSLVLANQNAARNFFQYSRPLMEMPQACDLIYMVLLNLHNHVKNCLALDKSVDSSPVVQQQQQQPRQRSKKKKRLQEDKENANTNVVNVPEPAAVEKPASDSKLTLDNHVVVQGLLDAAAILWMLHMQEMSGTESEDRLYKLTQDCIQPFMLYYKNNFEVFSSVLFLTSLVPVNVVTQQCHVTSIVLSQLKRLTLDDPADVALTLINPLCLWNRGGDVLELAQEWLHGAFEGDQALQSQKERTMRRRVTFKVHQDPKPQLALNFLDSVFHYPSNKKKVMAKSYDNVLELWNEIDSVKDFIIERLVLDEPLGNQLLNDDVLQRCVFRYAKLIPILSKKEPLFDSCQQYIKLLNWAEESLFHFLPDEVPDKKDEVPLVVAVLRDILLVAHEMVSLGFDDTEFCVRLAAFTKTLLTTTDCSLVFVHEAVCVINALTENVKVTSGAEDSSRLIRVVVPSLVAAVLSVLSAQLHPQDVLTANIKNLANLKNVLCNVLVTIEKFYGVSSKLKTHLLEAFVDALVQSQAHLLLQPVIGQLLNLKDQSRADELSCGLSGKAACESLQTSMLSSSSGNSVDQANKMHMPYLATQLMTIFLSRPTLGNALVAVLINKANTEYSQDKDLAAVCSSILKGLLSSPGKLATKHVQEYLRAASEQDASDSGAATSTIHTSSSVPARAAAANNTTTRPCCVVLERKCF